MKTVGSGVCIDPEARDRLERLQRAFQDRAAASALVARAESAPAGIAAADPPPRLSPPEPGPRRYVHFEIPNPAVSVTQNADGTYDIHTVDPGLAGSVLEITAVTGSGDEDKIFVQIPSR